VSPQLVQAIRPYESFLIVVPLKAQNLHRGLRSTLAFLAAGWSSGVAQFVQLHGP